MKSKSEITRLAVIVITLIVMVIPPISHGQAGGDLFMGVILYEGTKRTYWVYTPSSYDDSHHVPLVMALHGAGDNGYNFLLATGWINLSEENDFIVASPTGSIPYSSGFRWNIYNWTDSPDDVGFLMELINRLNRDYLIDSNRVYMTGYSNGASMANSFAFKHADTLAALAPVSGRWMTGLDIDPYKLPQPNARIPVYIWRGENETYEGGSQTRDVQDQLQKQYWIDWDKVSNAPIHVTEGIYKTEIYVGDGVEVRFTEVAGRGHNTYDSDTAAKIWSDFFTRFNRVSRGQANPDLRLWVYLAVLFASLLTIGVGVAMVRQKRHKIKQESTVHA